MPDAGDERRRRLERARLYLVCGRRPESFLRSVLDAGVDMVQLRDKGASENEIFEAAEAFRRCCEEAGALFVLNDRPDLAVAVGADGVHVGQRDAAMAEAREVVGRERLVGLSTHGPGDLDADRDVDYVAVGPVRATPTKPGRPAIGLAPVRYAARHARVPFFAIGGIDTANVDEVVAAGARRIVVVRAIEQAEDPAAAARALRGALPEIEEAVVGTS